MNIEEIILDNGLTVWLNEDHTQPIVNGCVVVKSGAKDTPNTGIAHYFEHIMFKGTDKIGTIDYAAEKPLLDSIAQLYAQLSKETDEKKRIEIQKKINKQAIKAAQYAIPNDFNNLISQYGGTKLNASTGWDSTIYFNTFSPSFFEHWCAINSERLIAPVFRLFQSELETVYEEKNMYVDAMGQLALEKTLARFFSPHPYQYPILGSSKHLKNPNLQEMEAFFEKHYVAGNMGLILTGDFYSEEVIPHIKRYFGRIKGGTVSKEKCPMPRPFKGKEQFKVKLPIPMVKASAMLWHGVPTAHADELPLKIMTYLFTNDNKSGLLDEMVIEGKLMQGMATMMSMNDAGVIILMAVPNIPLQTNRMAQKHLQDAVEKVKSGAFSEKLFQHLKMDLKRNELKDIEDIDQRLQKMIEIFSSNKKWEDHLDSIAKIDDMTQADVVRMANKYLTENYLQVKKKTGNYKGEKVQPLPFAPIVPPDTELISPYAHYLQGLKRNDTPPRFLDFDKDLTTVSLTAHHLVKLHHVKNPINQLFDLDIVYEVGSDMMPTLPHIASYLNYIGTHQYDVKEINQQLQEKGATVSFVVSNAHFTINVSGTDEHFEETLHIVQHFLKNLKADEKKFKKIVDEKKINDKASQKSFNTIADAAYQYVKFGKQSTYLRQLSHSELKKLSGQQLLDDVGNIQTYQTQLHYCGTIDVQTVSRLLVEKLPIASVSKPTRNPLYKPPQQYDHTTIHLVHDSKATQSIIYGYTTCQIEGVDERTRNLYQLFDTYFGGGMSSVLFQEVRELRSLAYRTRSWFIQPPRQHATQPSSLNMMLSTQADKTPQALQLLHTLLQDLPMNPKRFENTQQTYVNRARNAYPSFRKISKAIVYYQEMGYTKDPNPVRIEETNSLQLQDLLEAYRPLQNSPMTYIVVGNTNKIDCKALESVGQVKILNKKEIFK